MKGERNRWDRARLGDICIRGALRPWRCSAVEPTSGGLGRAVSGLMGLGF
jgi:hypothetical protein